MSWALPFPFHIIHSRDVFQLCWKVLRSCDCNKGLFCSSFNESCTRNRSFTFKCKVIATALVYVNIKNINNYFNKQFFILLMAICPDNVCMVTINLSYLFPAIKSDFPLSKQIFWLKTPRILRNQQISDKKYIK